MKGAKGDFCNSTNGSGTCKYLNNCPSALENIHKLRIYPKICSFSGLEPIICCENQFFDIVKENETQVEKQKDKPGDSCKLKYGGQGTCEYVDNCDFQTDRIYADSWNWCSVFNYQGMICCHKRKPKSVVACNHYRSLFNYLDPAIVNVIYDNNTDEVLHTVGGTPAFAGEFPHMALIGFGDKRNKVWNCGGTLISENYVLTAAHCLYDSELGEAKYIKLGALDLSSPFQFTKSEDFDIIAQIKHDDYKPPLLYNDLALLKLDRNVNFSLHIHPACLYDNYTIPVNTLTASGWGATEYLGDLNNHLLKVDLSLYTFEECYPHYDLNVSKRILPHGINNRTQLCSGGRHEEKDTCQGDSGGPLQMKTRNDIFFIVGITSFGKACAIGTSPGVYTRVSAFVPWIENIVWS